MHHHHLSDRDLVLALDGELPFARRGAVADHLVECAACRARWIQLEQGVELAAGLQRFRQPDAAQIAASREDLRSKLAETARPQESFIERLAPPFGQPLHWAMVGAAVVALVLLIRVAERPEVRLTSTAVATSEYDALPVASLTPGATWNLTVDEVCAPGGHEQRPVSAAVRREVLRPYGMDRVPPDEYELDYLITPELGGAPDARNLWPQRYRSRTWNAHVKDQLERLLPKLVCDGAISLQTAQREIAADWIAAYKKHFRTDVPLTARASLGADPVRDTPEDAITYPVWRRSDSATLSLISLSVSR